MRTYFFSYPRSGKEWQEIRMMLCLHRLFPGERPDISYGTLLETTTLRHFGYSQVTQKERTSSIGEFPPEGSKVFFILRDAKATLTSAFYYANFFMSKTIPGVLERFGTPSKLEDYVTGEWGVDRFCRYLNDVQDLLPRDKYDVSFLYFEDQFNLLSVHVVPQLLGLDRELTKDEAEYIFKMSSKETIKKLASGKKFKKDAALPKGTEAYMLGMVGADKDSSPLRNGTVDSYKEELSAEVQDYIDQYLRANSRLPEYNLRYLVKNEEP